MHTQTSQPPADAERPAARKLRAIAFGGGIGMFPPLMQGLKEDFEIVATIGTRLPVWFAAWMRLISIRWPRESWYRRWRYHMEKTPDVFRRLTRDAERQLAAYAGRYDAIIFFGAMHAPGPACDKPVYVFTDSCRWLSSRNAHDEVSHFRTPEDERDWIALEGEVYRRARRVFVGSEFVRAAIVAHYGVPASDVVVTGFGAGFGFDAPYEKAFDGRTILYIGKGDFQKKGGTLLMQAFAEVRKVIPDAQLHVVGQDRLPSAEGVVNHGFVRERERLVALMRAAHVFALPSLVDRNPISILDAMAASTPCVASDYGAMPEMVGDAGLIAPCNDMRALVDALLRILRDGELARTMGLRGRQRFETRFNWPKVWRIVHDEVRQAQA